MPLAAVPGGIDALSSWDLTGWDTLSRVYPESMGLHSIVCRPLAAFAVYS